MKDNIVQANIIDTREIALPKGGTLHVEITQEFINKVRIHFNLPIKDEVSNDHIRMFLWGAVNNATNKAEKRMKHG